MNSLHCTPALHAATFASHPYLGLELAAGDVVELRQCSLCSEMLRRPLGIDLRLAQARQAYGGIGDQPMIGRCERALSPDPFTGQLDESAVRSFVEMVAMEDLMRTVRP